MGHVGAMSGGDIVVILLLPQLATVMSNAKGMILIMDKIDAHLAARINRAPYCLFKVCSIDGNGRTR
jgi:hypothetical protein